MFITRLGLKFLADAIAMDAYKDAMDAKKPKAEPSFEKYCEPFNIYRAGERAEAVFIRAKAEAVRENIIDEAWAACRIKASAVYEKARAKAWAIRGKAWAVFDKVKAEAWARADPLAVYNKAEAWAVHNIAIDQASVAFHKVEAAYNKAKADVDAVCDKANDAFQRAINKTEAFMKNVIARVIDKVVYKKDQDQDQDYSEAWEEAEDVWSEASDVYEKAKAEAEAFYKKAKAKAWVVYEKAEAGARAVYDKACAEA